MIKLHYTDGTPVWVNPAHILRLEPGFNEHGESLTCLYMIGPDRVETLFVLGKPQTIASVINKLYRSINN